MPCNDAAHPGRLKHSSPHSSSDHLLAAVIVGVLHSPSFLLCASSRLPRRFCGVAQAVWPREAHGGVIVLEKRLLFLRSRCNIDGREAKREKRPDSSKGLVITLRHTIGEMHACSDYPRLKASSKWRSEKCDEQQI